MLKYLHKLTLIEEILMNVQNLIQIVILIGIIIWLIGKVFWLGISVAAIWAAWQYFKTTESYQRYK